MDKSSPAPALANGTGEWKLGRGGLAFDLLGGVFLPCFLAGYRSHEMGYNGVTNCLCFNPFFFLDRTARHLGMKRTNSCGWCVSNSGLFCTWLVSLLPKVGFPLYWLFMGFVTSQASSEISFGVPDALKVDVGNRPQPSRVEAGTWGGEWPSAYGDVCVDGAGPCCCGFFFGPLYLAYNKSLYDGSGFLLNVCAKIPTVYEEIRAQHGILPHTTCGCRNNSCGYLSPCCSDVAASLLPCGIIQMVHAMRAAGGGGGCGWSSGRASGLGSGKGRYYIDDVLAPEPVDGCGGSGGNYYAPAGGPMAAAQTVAVYGSVNEPVKQLPA